MRREQRPIKHQGFELLPLSSNDRQLYCCLFTDPFVMQYIAMPLAEDRANLLFGQALKPKPESKYYYWTVCSADGTQLGIAAFVMQEQGVAEFGLMLLPEFCFKGYSVPILSGLINYGFTEWRLDAVVAKHQDNNRAAPGLLRRLKVQKLRHEAGYCFWQLERKYWVDLRRQPPYLTLDGE